MGVGFAVHLPRFVHMNMDMTMKIARFLLAVCAIVSAGCSSTRSILFEQADKEAYAVPMRPPFVLAPDDEVEIVFAGVNPDAVIPFQINTYSDAAIPSSKFRVDRDGMVTLPVLGKQQVGGMTEKEAEAMLVEKAAKYLKEPLVQVRIRNATLTVVGEVYEPRTFTIARPITLLEALSSAGDLMPSANRENILVQRMENGQLKQYRINLRTDEWFSSPCYYLQKGDVVYVSPRHGAKTKLH